MERLTYERCNGIKRGYWSPAKKEEIVQALGKYEDTGLMPEEICRLKAKAAKIEVCEVPSAEAASVRHGQWLPVDENEDAFDCSECDAMVQKRHNFCPKCGAKMDVKE